MQEKNVYLKKKNQVFLPAISRPLVIFGIGLLFLQFLWIPAFAQSIEYYNGYNVISYDDGSKDVISGALNFLKWDGTWRPKDELNISNGSWPYLFSENETTADFQVDDATLSIPKDKTKFKLRPYSVSYDLTFPKIELEGQGLSLNSKSAPIHLPYNLKSRKPETRYNDKHNIKYGRLHFTAGTQDIAIHDDTLRDYIEGGKIIQDVTYLFPGDYSYGIDNNGEIILEFMNDSLNKLTGNVTIEIRTWDIIGPTNWGGNVTFSQATDVKANGKVELQQKVNDAALYTRFDEGSGNIIHNENTLNLVPTVGDLLGVVGTDTWTTGKYGQAIHFDGVKNKVLFNDHADFRLPDDFTISFYIQLAPGVNNKDTDIMRKGSTATALNKEWWKVEVKCPTLPNDPNTCIIPITNLIQGIVFNNESSEIAEKDIADRRDGLWHFVAYTREGNTCSLIVDDSTVANRTDCATNISNSAQLAIGGKDTEISGTGMDYINGTIDEVRLFNRKLSASDLNSIKNNEHIPVGSVTRNLSSLIHAGVELKESGCNGTWDSSITKVDVMASINNVSWDMIQSNATPNALYSIDTGNNYTYSRCSLSTTDSSKTPIIESIRARISPIGLYYNISVSTSPPGLIPQPTGENQYSPGQNATVAAQSVIGYTFQNWTENAIQVSTDPVYEFTVTGDRNLVAQYTRNSGYNISLSTSPSGLTPQPSGGGEYPSGQNITVTAQPVRGYSFRNWIENGIQVSTDPAYQFTVIGHRNLVAQYTLNTGSLVGWWKFDNDFLDWSGNGNDGICSAGCPTPTTGKVGSALYFDGNGSIDAGNGARLNITGNITIEAWVKPAKLATQYIVKKATNDATNGYELSLASSGKAFFRFNQRASSNTYRVDSAINYPSNNTTWVHLVGIYNGTQLQIYLNGHLSNNKSGSSNISSNTNNLKIGGPDGTAFYKGSIDDVRIWNRALTPQEVEAFYNGQNPVYTISVLTSPSDLNPSPIGAGQYPFGQKATVTAQPVYGYIFRNWTESGNEVSTSSAYQFMVTENRNLVAIFTPNKPPVSEAGGPYTVDEGSSVTVDASGSSDPDGDNLTYAWDLDNDGTYENPGVTATLTPPDGTANIIVGLQVSDGNGGVSTDTATVNVNNIAPIVDAGPDTTINEGSAFSSSGSFTDPGTDTWTATVDYGDGSGVQSLALSGKTFLPNHVYADNGTYMVSVTVNDDDLGEGSDTAIVTVINVVPTVGPITAPNDPLSVGTEVAAGATFTDPGTMDTHTALWNWGDGTTSQGMVTGTSVAGSHIYTTAGIYTVTLTVTDDDGGAGSATYMYVVIYDPTGGFITGGGWITSPVGAYMADPKLTGRAIFSFDSKYQKGAQVPTGESEFQFEVANLEFQSTSYEWLVVAGTRAQYKGTGTINGLDGYGFMLTAIDGTPDRLRIKIWNKTNEEIIYDNKNGSPDTGNDTTELGGGSIVIHAK